MPRSVFSREYKRFCALLVEERKAAHMTQSDVARRLRKPQSFVSKYEAGERRLDLVEFLHIAKAIGFDPARFVERLKGG
jgi:transcriptional regulator with XRE-family HTH domain